MKLDEIAQNPSLLSTDIAHYHIRLLKDTDSDALGAYFEGLSAETRRRFGPHPLDLAKAKQLCEVAKQLETMRWLALQDERVVAYIILELSVNEWETGRYAQQNIDLDSALDCTVAPSVADALQGQGLGTAMMRHIIGVAQALGRRYMVLMGGTQSTNAKAIRHYEKLDFQKLAEFEEPQGVQNQDMFLKLQEE